MTSPVTPASKKVVQILYSGLGGHGSVAFSLARAKGAEQWLNVFGFVGVEPLLPAYRDFCTRNGFDFASFSAPPGRPWRQWGAIFRWLRKIRPDAIILHSPPSLPPILGFTLVSGIRPVVVEHQPNALKKRSDWIFGAIAMLAARNIVLLTPVYRAEMRAKFRAIFRSNKVELIPNGIDICKFRPMPVRRGEESKVRLGMAARFTRAKRQDTLIDMMSTLMQRRPDIDWCLELPGDGETHEEIAKRVKAFGLESRVVLPGNLDELELASWYKTLDIYLHASDGETLSTSMLQAMATGLPIVGSNVEGIRGLLTGSEVCGILARNGDPCDFAHAVIDLVSDTERSKLLGRKGRKLCENEFSTNKMRTSYELLLRK